MASDSGLGAALDDVSLPWIAALAAGMALAPWPFGPEPHLIQKIRMLFAGTLTRPIDMFDLFIHGLPLVLLVAKLIRIRTRD